MADEEKKEKKPAAPAAPKSKDEGRRQNDEEGAGEKAGRQEGAC